MQVDGVGPIALPLLPVQAASLIASAEAAPYGRGEDTLVDPAVRRTWQIAPERVHLQGRHWQRTLDAIVARAAEGLGVDEAIEAEFYKLLIYDEGSFFVGHRDTEKAPGMFATLVIVLPSLSSGGELVVRHGDREVRLDLRCDDPAEAAFAAFYADCVHEVLPVTDGCRLTLVYNLLRHKRGSALRPPSYVSEQARAEAMLRRWRAGEPEKLVYPLQHAYTQAELAIDTLKGVDAAVAGVLIPAALQAKCELHLALVTAEESGIAEYTSNYRRGWSGPSEDEFEAGEVTDNWVTLSNWRSADGSDFELGDLPVLEGEFSPPDFLDNLEPDEEHFREATGNEGASFERTYRRAALVMWPRDRRFAVFCQAGLTVTLPALETIVGRWETDRQTTDWQDAHEFAGHIIEQWRVDGWYPRQETGTSNAARMLGLLARLADTERIEGFIKRITTAGVYGEGDNQALLAAFARMPAKRQTALLTMVVHRTATKAFPACADLLARAAGDVPGLGEAARRLVETMPGDPARFVPEQPWQRPTATEPATVVCLLTALIAIDRSLVDRAATYMLAWPKTYDLDRVLVPALRQLAQRGDPAIAPLLSACRSHLRARIAEELAPPRDWRRQSAVGCTCEHCRQLSAFLDDPALKLWVLRAAEYARGHVEGTIRASQADVDTVTERRGRPYSLICTKNQASYERRARQRSQDLSDIALLDG